MARDLSAAYAILRDFEKGPDGKGPALRAYLCPANKWTIGYGHTGSDVHEGLTITADWAEFLLRGDVSRNSAAVERVCPKATDAQHNALVCFAFNVKNWHKQGLIKLHNAGDYAGAGKAFGAYVNATGADGKKRPLRGLVRRRAAEAALYMSDDGLADEQRTRAVEVVPATPAVTASTVSGGAAGTALAVSEVANQLKDTQGLLEPLAMYSDTIRTAFVAVAVLAIVLGIVVKVMKARKGVA